MTDTNINMTDTNIDPTPEQIRSLLRHDFVAFTRKVFVTLNPGREFKLNWHHSVIAHQVTEVIEGRCKRLIINIPPRYLKSIMVSVALPAFLLGHDPHKRIICASYAQELSSKLSRDCRTIIESPWYHLLFPATRLDAEHKTASDFATTQRGMRYATSVGGVLTGLGADLIIVDDPMKPVDALSPTLRENVIEWFNSTVSTRLDNKNEGAIIIVMQRLHLDDLAGHLRRARGWRIIDIPAIAPEARDYEIGKGLVYRREADEVLQPDYESRELLLRQKRTMGSLPFEAQYQQNPVPAEGMQIKREWLRFYDDDPVCGFSSQIFQSWDTASSSRELADYSVGTTWFVEGDRYYLLDVCRERLTYPELKKEIRRYADIYGCRQIIIEAIGAGKHLLQEFEAMGMPAIAYMPKGDKAMRLAAVSPLIESGAVLFPRSARWRDDCIIELLQFPNGSHDDQVDSISQFLNYMIERKSPDTWRTSF
jgi:predicted phage terminase large subunit-like protein